MLSVRLVRWAAWRVAAIGLLAVILINFLYGMCGPEPGVVAPRAHRQLSWMGQDLESTQHDPDYPRQESDVVPDSIFSHGMPGAVRHGSNANSLSRSHQTSQAAASILLEYSRTGTGYKLGPRGVEVIKEYRKFREIVQGNDVQIKVDEDRRRNKVLAPPGDLSYSASGYINEGSHSRSRRDYYLSDDDADWAKDGTPLRNFSRILDILAIQVEKTRHHLAQRMKEMEKDERTPEFPKKSGNRLANDNTDLTRNPTKSGNRSVSEKTNLIKNLTESVNDNIPNKKDPGGQFEMIPNTREVSPTDLAMCEDWTISSGKDTEDSLSSHVGLSESDDVGNALRRVPLWQRKLAKFGTLGDVSGSRPGYCLTEWLQVRIYSGDKARWTIRELKQWIHFLFLGGVQHIYLCDHYATPDEKLDAPLRRYIDLDLVTYIPWGPAENVTRVAIDAQVQCYDYIVKTYGHFSKWQIAIDMDEYPYAPLDAKENFLSRYLHHVTSRRGAKISEISLSNYLMLGQGDPTEDMAIGRINRITKTPENGLIKPIFRPDRVKSAAVHHNDYTRGTRLDADKDELVMLHYWGARLQHWGPDTERMRAMTRPMPDMRTGWAERLRNSLLAFGEVDAFSNATGP